MGTTETKLAYLDGTKHDIAEAIRSKGVEVLISDTFRSYADKIRSISTAPEDLPYSELFKLATSIYNTGIPDDSAVVNFTEEEEQKCLQIALNILIGGI